MKLGHHLFLKLLLVNFDIDFALDWYPQKLKENREE